jgi:hypothetical protein
LLLYSQQNLLSLFIMFYFILRGFGPQGGEYFNIRLYFVAPYWGISSKFSSKSLIPTYIPASPPGGLTLGSQFNPGILWPPSAIIQIMSAAQHLALINTIRIDEFARELLIKDIILIEYNTLKK